MVRTVDEHTVSECPRDHLHSNRSFFYLPMLMLIGNLRDRVVELADTSYMLITQIDVQKPVTGLSGPDTFSTSLISE